MTDASDSLSARSPAKVDPETLVLRGTPGRVTRFRREVVIAIAGLGSTAVIGAAWMALGRPSFRMLADGDDKVEVAPPPETVANAPRSYSEVPQLGPPLPGDLGRPILEHQRKTSATKVDPTHDARARAIQQAEAERQRLAAEETAARKSPVMHQLAGAATNARVSSLAVSAELRPRDELQSAPLQEQNDKAQSDAMIGRPDNGGDVNPHALTPPPSPWTLQAGSVIAAGLITGLNSDVPGPVTAQVTQNVYDSATGRTLLIPQGSRLIGSYDSAIAFGQTRALVVWERIILPDGSSIRIDNLPAADTQGQAGLADKVDFHSWQLLKGVALSTLLGVGTELTFGDESDLVEAIRESTQQSASRAGDQVVMKNLDIQPTVTVRPGWPLRIVAVRDIVLAPWREKAN